MFAALTMIDTTSKTDQHISTHSMAEQLLDRHYHLSVYQDLLNESVARRARPSESTIRPYPKLSFASSEQHLLRSLGKPNLKLSPQNALSDQLLFYRRLVAGYKVRFELHLHQDALFYAKWTFRHTSAAENEAIIETIAKKYLNDDEFNDRSEKIIDHQGHELIINRGVGLSIDYLDARAPALSQLKLSLSDWSQEPCSLVFGGAPSQEHDLNNSLHSLGCR